jgi:uncharacterized membrane protein
MSLRDNIFSALSLGTIAGVVVFFSCLLVILLLHSDQYYVLLYPTLIVFVVFSGIYFIKFELEYTKKK